MNAPYEMAKMLKKRENPQGYTPVAGMVEQLPDVRIRISDKVVLDSGDILSIIDLKQQSSDGAYINAGRRVYMLPLSGKKYLVIGVDVSL